MKDGGARSLEEAVLFYKAGAAVHTA